MTWAQAMRMAEYRAKLTGLRYRVTGYQFWPLRGPLGYVGALVWAYDVEPAPYVPELPA